MRVSLYLLPVLLICFSSGVKSQTHSENDSLMAELTRAVEDTQRVKILLGLCKTTLYNKPKQSIEFGNQALELALKINYKTGEALSLNALANAYEEIGDGDKAIENYRKALAIGKQLKDQKICGDVTNNMGTYFAKKGDYETCLKYFLEALPIWEKAGDNKNISMQLGNIGALYQLMGDLDESMKYHRKSLSLALQMADSVRMGVAMNNVGLIYVNKNMGDSALDYLEKALALARRIGDWKTIANARANLAGYYEEKGNFQKAIAFLRPEENAGKSVYALASAYLQLGVAYAKYGNTDSAGHYLERSVDMADSVRALFILKESYGTLATVYHKAGRHDEAFKYAFLFANIKDTILNQEKLLQMNELSVKYEAEKKELEISRLNAEKTADKIYKTALASGLSLVFILALVLLRGFRQKQKSNRSLEEKNELITLQKHLVEEKQKEIMDSITYAKRIQRAHLPTEKYVTRSLERLKDN